MVEEASSTGLAGRIAFITGGLRGIGRACAERFSAKGAVVGISDLSDPADDRVAEVLAGLAPAGFYIQADATDEAAWKNVSEKIESQYGALHVLVNNAGTDQTGPLSSLMRADWDRLMQVNTTSVYLATRTLMPLLIAGGKNVVGGASIINVSSIMGIVGQAEAAAYSASKGAVRLFTKAVAIEFASAGYPIRVNSLHPGCVDTPLLEHGIDRWVSQGFAESREQLTAILASRAPMGRLGRPEEIAAAAAFLAGPDSSYMTGAELVIDGGWTAQ